MKMTTIIRSAIFAATLFFAGGFLFTSLSDAMQAGASSKIRSQKQTTQCVHPGNPGSSQRTLDHLPQNYNKRVIPGPGSTRYIEPPDMPMHINPCRPTGDKYSCACIAYEPHHPMCRGTVTTWQERCRCFGTADPAGGNRRR
jgi:hypothetical protein